MNELNAYKLRAARALAVLRDCQEDHQLMVVEALESLAVKVYNLKKGPKCQQ